MTESELKSMFSFLEMYKKVRTEMEVLQSNREEIYRISRTLPEIEWYKLMALYDDSIKNINIAWSKMMKK